MILAEEREISSFFFEFCKGCWGCGLCASGGVDDIGFRDDWIHFF
jgi:hypothetical protein